HPRASTERKDMRGLARKEAETALEGFGDEGEQRGAPEPEAPFLPGIFRCGGRVLGVADDENVGRRCPFGERQSCFFDENAPERDRENRAEDAAAEQERERLEVAKPR